MKLGTLPDPKPGRQISHEFAYAAMVACAAEALFHNLGHPSTFVAGAGRVAAMSCALYIVGLLAATFRHALHRPKAIKDTLALTIVTIVFLVVGWSTTIVGLSLADYFKKHHVWEAFSPNVLHFLVPYAAGGLIPQAILGLHASFVYAFAVGLVTIVYSGADSIFGIYVLVSSLIASLSLVRIRSRLIFMRVGLSVSLAAIVYVFVSVMVSNSGVPTDITAGLIAAVLGGFFASLVAAGSLPLVEYLGGFVTDIRLIEMATLDHPLLKELSIQAPGTWNHSNVMGMMAETAADAVGANAWLARVGAYFHDVGKMKKPLYFVENQAGGENRHDKLSPSMSALIIRSHVKDGLELARKHKLPRVIMDMIEQHHGTSPIEYFYDKALKEAQAEGKEVDKSHYCYPGPRPQTREAGILMLADCIEAASRTLPEPTADRIQGMVQKMINKVFASGQLNECELTLADLHQIAKCFTRVLSGIFHHRVSYSEPAEKVRVKSSDDANSTVEGNTVTQDGVTVGSSNSQKPKESSDDLKRLGIEG